MTLVFGLWRPIASFSLKHSITIILYMEVYTIHNPGNKKQTKQKQMSES